MSKVKALIVRKHVNDLYEDLRDGHNLISLLEVLSGDTLPRERDFLKTLRLVSATEACEYEQHEDVEDEDKGPREKGRMRFHRLQNVQIALDYLKRRQKRKLIAWISPEELRVTTFPSVVHMKGLKLQEPQIRKSEAYGENQSLHHQLTNAGYQAENKLGYFWERLQGIRPRNGQLLSLAAEKEEQYVDPAKTPLNPEKYSPGRKYFRRKPIKKTGSDKESVKENNENEGKKRSNSQPSKEQPAPSSRGLVQQESVTPKSALGDGIQQKETEVRADSVKQKLLPSAVSSWSDHVKTSPAKDSDIEVKVGELDERISEEDSTPYCTKRKKHLDDGNTSEITLQEKIDVLSFRKAASLSSIPSGIARSLEKSGFAEVSSESYSSIQERQNTERFCPHETEHFQFKKRRCHSLCISVSSVSKNTDGNESCDIHHSQPTSTSSRCSNMLT
ncbi:hypothetical protein P7K49_008158 [Saguinus oedipus]|uniref:Calponin-homology (CH) domain-containing protein n=1 Tax=Saguinus oedipus TaxID=9490 RepID=A0ABQ9VX19_SAGOE|nr:hypothetical protein P7K49_008158 [Saguinus oedipus]